MKTSINIFFISLLLAVGVGNAQTTISGVTMTGVTVNVPYDADYRAWLNRLTVLGYAHPTATCSQILSDMVAGIKADGNWTELDRFWFFAHNGDSDGATVDMIDPSGHAQATKVNSPGWTAKRGFNSNATSSYLGSGYNPFTGVQLTQDDASMGFWMHTGAESGASTRTVLGVISATPFTNNMTINEVASNNLSTRFMRNDGANNLFTGISAPASGASYAVDRTSSSGGNQYANGSSTNTYSATSTAPPNHTLYILARNRNDAAADNFGNSSWIISSVWIGSSSVNQAEMHSRVSTAMTAIAALP